MNDSIVKYGEGTVNSRFLRELADQMEKNEVNQERLLSENTALKIENKSLKEENNRKDKIIESQKRYGINSSESTSSRPREDLTTLVAMHHINDTRKHNGIKGRVTKEDINKVIEDAGLIIMEGPRVIGITSEGRHKVSIQAQTVVKMNNEVWNYIIDKFTVVHK